MKRLPANQRNAVEQLILRNPPLKLREAAEREGVAISTMSYRVKMGLKRLANALGNDPEPGNGVT